MRFINILMWATITPYNKTIGRVAHNVARNRISVVAIQAD